MRRWSSDSLRRGGSGTFGVHLASSGFTVDDAIAYLDRTGTVEPWQSLSIAHVEAMATGVEAFDPDDLVDTLRVGYLLATVPPSFLPHFIECLARLADALDQTPRFRGREVTPNRFSGILAGYVEEMRAEIGEPGSNGVRIEIERTYPR